MQNDFFCIEMRMCIRDLNECGACGDKLINESRLSITAVLSENEFVIRFVGRCS